VVRGLYEVGQGGSNEASRVAGKGAKACLNMQMHGRKGIRAFLKSGIFW
jgi:glutamate/tyrosine decarboxylase-like PLP-dependent enzyme